MLGIECDGTTYHRTATARDRDRIRQEVLEELGWNRRLIRIWSTDWIRNPAHQIERITNAFREALLLPVTSPPAVPEVSPPLPEAAPIQRIRDFHDAKPTPRFADIEDVPDDEIERVLLSLVVTFGVTPREDLITSTAREFGFKRTTKRISARIESVIQSLVQQGRLRDAGDERLGISLRHQDPSVELKALIALSRFGGVRVPSEPCSMRWRDIDWAGNRMTVHSPKTDHHIGKGERVVPIFPGLRPYLDEPFVAATKDFEQTINPDDWVLPSFRREAANDGNWRGVNLRTQFEKIIKRAGVPPWPRLWHNLRASSQTELEEHFPSHVVCAWLGNSEAVARKHYLQVREVDFQKAARIPARGTPESGDFETHGVTTNAKTPGNPRVVALKMGDTGFEPVTSTV